MQIVHHPNWYRDFLEDMARRGPTHLRDASEHCPVDNTINSFTHYFGDKSFIKSQERIEELAKYFDARAGIFKPASTMNTIVKTCNKIFS
mgnify:CR=1 FL=1